MRRVSRNRRSQLSVLAVLAGTAILVAACGTAQATPSSTGSGLASVPPSDTASAVTPTVAPTDTPTPAPTPSVAATLLPPVKITLKAVTSGLPNVIGISTAPGDSRLFAIRQTGQIVIISGGKVSGTFLDIAARMSCCGERGLLGLAFHPQYATNGRFFVRYTDLNGNLRISELHVSSDPAKANAASEKILLTIPHPTFANHNGGRIEFGPDGYLYIGTGDGGSGGDPNNHGQSLVSRLGKMLRIDVDGQDSGLPYAVPPSNPFVGQSGKAPEIWAYGLRNPYSFSFDKLTGDLWIADVGQDAWEEIDRATATNGGGRGIDYGWSVMEGRHCYKPGTDCVKDGLTLPIAEYSHGAGDSIGCSVIGGYVYRGSLHPELFGRYFFSDYCSGRIWDLNAAGSDTQSPQELLKSGLQLTGWGQDSGGELYVVATNGVLYQLG